MKLGIVVCYLVNEDNEKLLDIHLQKIKENTTSPFTVYAGTNMLLPQFVKKLRQYDFIKLCACNNYEGPDEKSRGVKEHSHYLEQLIKVAIDEGVSHIVIMHPDSFPLKVGWEEYLENKLSKSHTLVSIFPQMSACTFFNRDFYLKYQPRLLPSNKEEASISWTNFQKANQATNLVEGGMGYGYKTYLESLGWYRLKRSNKGEYNSHIGSIFDDVIFHLGSASEYKNRSMSGYGKFKLYRYFRKVIAKILSNSIKKKIQNILSYKVLYPEVKINKDAFMRSREKLINDPEGYLKFLRNGKNKSN